MHDSMAFYATVDDPQELSQVEGAYCALVETHINYETKALRLVFKCWRSRMAFEAKRAAFAIIPIDIAPDKGGIDYFKQYGTDGAGMQMGPNLRDYCKSRCTEFTQGRCVNDSSKEPSDVSKS